METSKEILLARHYRRLAYKEHHQTLITKAKELLEFANSGTVTITQGIDGVSVKCKAKVTKANTRPA